MTPHAPSQEPGPPEQPSFRLDEASWPIKQAIEQELHFIEAALGNRRVQKEARAPAPSHPAIARYKLLRHALTGWGLKYYEEVPVLAALGWSGLDRSNWTPDEVPEGYKAWADSALPEAHQLRRRFSTPDQYHDVVSELVVWGALRAKGHDVTLVSLPGRADISVTGPAFPNSLVVEVKRIKLATPVNRLANVLRTANRQLKAQLPPDHGGILFLRVERELSAADPPNAEIPFDLYPVLDWLERALRGSENKSVNSVVVFWEEMHVSGEPPAPTQYVFRRRAAYVREGPGRRPLSSPLADVEAISPASTTRGHIEWPAETRHALLQQPLALPKGVIRWRSADPSAPVIYDDVDTSIYLVRTEVARGVLRTGDGRLEGYTDDQGLTSITAVQLVDDSVNKPYVVAALGMRSEGNRLAVGFACRLYSTDARQLRLWTEDARFAWRYILYRYCIEFAVGNWSGKHLWYREFDTSNGWYPAVVPLARTRSGEPPVSIGFNERQSTRSKFAFFFMFDIASYHADLRWHLGENGDPSPSA